LELKDRRLVDQIALACLEGIQSFIGGTYEPVNQIIKIGYFFSASEV
jgi:hypothetical protein